MKWRKLIRCKGLLNLISLIDDTASFCKYMSSCINIQINDYKLYSFCVKDCRYEISCLGHNDYCSVPMLLLWDRCDKLYLADSALGYIYGNSDNVQYRGISDIYDDWNDSRTDNQKEAVDCCTGYTACFLLV